MPTRDVPSDSVHSAVDDIFACNVNFLYVVVMIKIYDKAYM